MITQEELKNVLSYDENTGIFTRIRPHPLKKSLVNKNAGFVNKNGYVIIKIGTKAYKAHRLALLYVTGMFPDEDTDHINGNRSDNRIENLRPATRSENIQNLKNARIDNISSGLLGVSFKKSLNKYCSGIRIDGIRKHLGYYETAIEAHDVYLKEKRKLHNFCTI